MSDLPKLDADWVTRPASRAVCGMLTVAGHKALFVGGCVRNALLGAPVADIDIATDARPEAVVELAAAAGLKSVPTGIDHGTVTVIAKGIPHEITTFRRDLETDGRRAVVAFSDDLTEDAARRDFTMNALYADSDGQVIDPIGGWPDLAARRVRFVGDADGRITEDYLRILRFFRFHAWYGDPAQGLDVAALDACARHADGLVHVSAERIGAEVTKLLSAPDPAPSVAAMAQSGVLNRVLPGADATALPVLVHIEAALGAAPDPVLRLAAMTGPDAADRLRLSRVDARRLTLVGALARDGDGPGAMGYRHGAKMARSALVLRGALMNEMPTADALGKAETAAGMVCPVTSADLQPAYSGPALGARLRQVTDAWIASDFALDRAALLALPDEAQDG